MIETGVRRIQKGEGESTTYNININRGKCREDNNEIVANLVGVRIHKYTFNLKLYIYGLFGFGQWEVPLHPNGYTTVY